MKKTRKKRSGSRQAYEGGYLLGKGAAGKAAKKVQERKSTRKKRMSSVMREIRKTRGK